MRILFFIVALSLSLSAFAQQSLGSFIEDDTIHFIWTTVDSSGEPITRSTDGTVSVYKDNGTSQSVAGVTDTEDFDMLTGVHAVTIDLSADAFYATGSNYIVTINGAVVDTVTVNAPIAYFTIENNFVNANMIRVSGDSTSADNLELQYDTTGIVGDTFPATQQSVSNIANLGSAVNKTAASYVLTTGTQSSGTISSTQALDGTNHEHTDDAGAMDLYYQFEIGSGVPSSVTMTGFLNSNNDDLEVYGFDWVASAWVQIGILEGKNASTNEVDSYELFVDMVGSTGNEGIVRVRFTDGAFTLTSATLAIDQIFVSFNQGSEGYDNGAVWLDTTFSNTNTEVGIDGVARNPVSTIAATNTLLASTNLHRVEVAPGSSFTLAASQTDEVFRGHDWTLALGGQDITGIYVRGAIISGTATATGRYVIEDSELMTVTLDDAALIEHSSLAGTFTIGQAGTYTFHDCFNESGSEITIDFGALGATTVHLFAWEGEINFTNMAAGDFVHITGAGTITTTTSTGGTIEHDGFFEYTDAGANITEQQSDIKVNVDAILVDTGTTIDSGVTAIQAVTDLLPDAGALSDLALILADTGTTLPAEHAAFNDVSTANLDTALSDIHLDHLLAVDYDPASPPGTSTAWINELTESNAGVSRYTAAALNQAPGGSDGSGFTAIPWNAAWDAEVESEVDDALVAMNLDHLLFLADSDDVVDDTVMALIADSGATADWSAYVNTTDSLRAIRDRGDLAWGTSGISGSGAVTSALIHDGGTDLVYETDAGAKVQGGLVRVYITSEYNAGLFTIRGFDTTDVNGAWGPIFLDPGAYTFTFEKVNVYGVSTKTATVP